MYARVVTDPAYPGRLALQYWFFYVFNDFNDKHEGDWEMIQLDFDAADGAGAHPTPVEVGYSQHEGAERAGGATRSSCSSTARIRSCTRPSGRTRTSSIPRSISGGAPRRASAATTRSGRRATCVRPSQSFRPTRRPT